jgi:hypothetical protein
MDSRLTLDLSSVIKPKKFEPILELENYSEDESLMEVFDKQDEDFQPEQPKQNEQEASSPVQDLDESFNYENYERNLIRATFTTQDLIEPMHPEEDDEFVNNVDYLVNENSFCDSPEYKTGFDGSRASRFRKSAEARNDPGNTDSKS